VANVPRLTREASGTSGMSAAMNGAVNVSIPDGWIAEFLKDGVNGFVIPAADPQLPEEEIDRQDAQAMYTTLQQRVLPLYYENHTQWLSLMSRSMQDVRPQFDSQRMAKAYYEQMYLQIG